jgi:hypothetical protein
MQLRSLTIPSIVMLSGWLPAQNPPPGTPPTNTPTTTPPVQKPLEAKDLTASGLPIQFYGFLRLDAYYNSARMDSVVLPTRVLPETGAGAKKNDDQFMLDPRLTRFGVDVKPGEVGSADVNLKLEMDFANFPTGSSESRATPRIRLAYIDVAAQRPKDAKERVNAEDMALRVGQDWDVVSPLFPAANGEMLMWNAGNTGDRRAQIQGRWKPADSTFNVKACLGLTGAVNNQDLDTPAGERDGFDSGMPHGQIRAGWRSSTEKVATDIGVWGMFGRTQTDTAFAGETRFDTWLGGIDFTVPVCDTFTVRGEVWSGENLGDIRGGIGQTINTTTGKEIASTGGWVEGVYQVSPTTKFHAGYTTDDPDNGDLNAGNPRRNLTGYVGTVMDWDCKLRTGFDVIYWETDYVGGALGNAMRFNLWFSYNF